jgi:DNA-binding NtrC family response regulator
MPDMFPSSGSMLAASPADQKIVAVVDDDAKARQAVRSWLESAGYEVTEYDTTGAAAGWTGETPAAVCIDLGAGKMLSLTLLEQLRAKDPELPLIVVTLQQDLKAAVAAMRAGAYDYVTKPMDGERLVAAVRRATERRALLQNVLRLQNALVERPVLGSIVGRSPPMRELVHQVGRVVESDVTVCIYGESGTGKELVARAIHAGGPRQLGPFVAINCAAIPGSLQESELFGHERGAFTGATQMRRGRFEQANGGSLFLDEIGEMSAATQASLLRTLQERTIRRVGGSQEIPIDVRIVCATHRDLRAEVGAGRFREDLYFRLVVYPIRVPALRERRDDVPLLVGHFLRELRGDVGREVSRINPEALDALSRYPWPGNVRELQNVVHRSMLACKGDEIELVDLPSDVRKYAARLTPEPRNGVAAQRGTETDDEIITLRELERQAIARALRRTRGNVGQAARLLGIGRATLYRRLATLELPNGSAQDS